MVSAKGVAEKARDDFDAEVTRLEGFETAAKNAVTDYKSNNTDPETLVVAPTSGVTFPDLVRLAQLV